jgi:NhaA family Na+:H+ antiporter
LSELPDGVSWSQIYGVGWLAGIGFTMSLFVADLAFAGPGEALTLAAAKVGVLVASVVAGAGGWLLLKRATRVPVAP